MKNRIFIIGIWIISCCPSWAQPRPNEIELDTAVKHGKLDNNFSYYLKPIHGYEGPLKMHFYVKVGQAFQESHEWDFAHALEHLAFRETTNFPKGLAFNPEILAEVGLYTRNLYGTTAGNFTSYDILVPNGNREARDLGLRWFRDIATELIISSESVDRERGVLLQEMAPDEINRDNRRANRLLESRLFSCLNDFENFVEQNKTFSHLDLQRFYRKWYRPDRMVVVILGNIEDVQELEKEIKDKFSDIPNSEEELNVPECKEEYYKSSPQFSIVQYEVVESVEESENGMQLNLFFRDPLSSDDFKSGQGIRKIILDDLISTVLDNRFGSLTKKYIPFYKVSSLRTTRNGFMPNAIKIIIDAEKTREREAIEEVVNLLNQTTTYGITDEELAQAKQNYLNSRNLFSGEGISYWEGEIEHLIIRQESLPDGKAKSLKGWLKSLSLKEFNEILKDVMSGPPEDIGILIPNDYETHLDSEVEIRNLIGSILTKPVEPFIPKGPPLELLSSNKKDSLALGGYTKIKSDIPVAQKFMLQNGVRVILRPTGTGDKKIYLHGFNQFGACCLPKEDFFSALYAPSIVKDSGAGDYNKFELQKFLHSTSTLKTGVFPYIQNNETGIKGSASSEEFDDLLQLAYLFFTEPRKDTLAFSSWKNQSLEYANSRAKLNDFIDLRDAFTNNLKHPIAIKIAEAIQAVDFDRSFEIYKTAYGSAENFTFIITGDFEVSSILPQIEKYLGNLPGSIEEKECKINEQGGVVLNDGPKFKKVKSPEGDLHGYYSLSYIKPKNLVEDWKYELEVEVLAAVANQIIRNLRAEGFSLYYYGVAGDYDRPMKRYEINFNYILLPEEWAQIRKRTFAVIEDLKAGNLSEGIFDNAIKVVLEGHSERRLNHPIRIQDAIYREERYREPFINPSEVERYIKSFSKDRIIELAQGFFQEKYQYELLKQ